MAWLEVGNCVAKDGFIQAFGNSPHSDPAPYRISQTLKAVQTTNPPRPNDVFQLLNLKSLILGPICDCSTRCISFVHGL